MALRRLLLAGSVGPERIPARTDPDDADWYLPLHVRDRATARERIADQVSAGADVVVAPTWLTHRRALLPLAETRRAAVWTADAVNVAREGVEAGLERRTEGPRQDEGEVQGQVQGHEPPLARPVPQVAACLPVLGHDPDPAVDCIRCKVLRNEER